MVPLLTLLTLLTLVGGASICGAAPGKRLFGCGIGAPGRKPMASAFAPGGDDVGGGPASRFPPTGTTGKGLAARAMTVSP